MRSLVLDRVMLVWIALIAATLLSWALGTGHDASGTQASVAILVIAFVKVRLVGRYFMELRDAPVALMLAFEAWIAVVAVAVVAMYVAGS